MNGWQGPLKTWRPPNPRDAEIARLKARVAELEESDRLLRQLLWARHGSEHVLYGDDGEMQCSSCCIDFKRNSAAEIDETFRIRALAIDAARNGGAQ
jgi:hypothetical protein